VSATIHGIALPLLVLAPVLVLVVMGVGAGSPLVVLPLVGAIGLGRLLVLAAVALLRNAEFVQPRFYWATLAYSAFWPLAWGVWYWATK
jgi:hypothetical protein